MPRRTLVSIPPPPWATDLLAWACHHTQVPTPELTWNCNPAQIPGFAGRAYTRRSPVRIMVVQCSDHDYNQASLLHEAAHHISALKGSGHGHSLGFYTTFWNLASAQGLLQDKIVLGEASYKSTAWPALLATGFKPSDELAAMAHLAGRHRALREAERLAERLADRIPRGPGIAESHPAWVAWQQALKRWWRLDQALRLA
jgi:hypothetical protein